MISVKVMVKAKAKVKVHVDIFMNGNYIRKVCYYISTHQLLLNFNFFKLIAILNFNPIYILYLVFLTTWQTNDMFITTRRCHMFSIWKHFHFKMIDCWKFWIMCNVYIYLFTGKIYPHQMLYGILLRNLFWFING